MATERLCGAGMASRPLRPLFPVEPFSEAWPGLAGHLSCPPTPVDLQTAPRKTSVLVSLLQTPYLNLRGAAGAKRRANRARTATKWQQCQIMGKTEPHPAPVTRWPTPLSSRAFAMRFREIVDAQWTDPSVLFLITHSNHTRLAAARLFLASSPSLHCPVNYAPGCRPCGRAGYVAGRRFGAGCGGAPLNHCSAREMRGRE